MLFRRVNSFLFSAITKEVMQSLQSSYVPSPELTKLKPYFEPTNISSLYQLLSESKSFHNRQIEQTLRQINTLNSSEASDEDKHASSRVKLDLSEIVIKAGDLVKAKEYLQEGLDVLRTMQDREDIEEAMFLRRLGEIQLMTKENHELALQHLLLSIKLFEQYTQDQEIHMSTAFGHLGPLHSLIAWYYLLHDNPKKAKQYTELAIPYFLKVPYNHNDFEHMMCTRISALIELGEIQQMRTEAKSVIKRTIDVSNKIWFLNILVQNGFKQHTEQLQTALQRIKQRLTPQKFQLYKQSMNICI